MAASSRPGILQSIVALLFSGAVLAAVLQYTLCSGTRLQMLEKPTGIACRDNATCRRELHEPSICRRDECVRLATKGCEVLADTSALEGEDTVWLGAMFPTAPAPEAADLRASVARTQRELSEGGAGDGPRGLPGMGPRHPLGILLCGDDLGPDPDAPIKNAVHLVSDVGVPAVIGFRSTEEAMRFASRTFRTELVILAREDEPLAAPRVPDNAWRLTFDSESTSRALASFVSDELEPQHRKLNDGDGDVLRVAVVRADHEAGAAFAKVLARHFAPLAARGITLRELTVADATVDALVALKPHVVVYAGEALGFLPIILDLDRRWAASSAWRPRYVGIGAPNAAFADKLETLAAVHVTPQVFAVVPKRRSAAQEAVVLIADAIRAVSPEEPLTGPAIAQVLARSRGNAATPLDPVTREAVGLEQMIVRVGPGAAPP